MAETNRTIKALRALLKHRNIPFDEMDKHVKELRGTNDRLVAVVGGSMIETALQGKLQRRMRPECEEDIFGPRAPLSSLAAKIEMAYALGLIDRQTRRHANFIREIRNVFAHRIAPTSFRTKEVIAVCKLLSVGKWEDSARLKHNMRRRYIAAVIATGNAIWGDESSIRIISEESGPPGPLPDK